VLHLLRQKIDGCETRTRLNPKKLPFEIRCSIVSLSLAALKTHLVCVVRRGCLVESKGDPLLSALAAVVRDTVKGSQKERQKEVCCVCSSSDDDEVGGGSSFHEGNM
jgi:hypothetical protein